MDKQIDALMEFGRLKFMSSVFRRILGFVIGAKVIVLVVTIFGLSGCMSSMPSTFPDVQLPSPQSSAGMPSPSSSSSSGPPTGSPMPQPNSGSQSSLPTPSLPTPGSPSSGNPSLPRPPSPTPSPDSSNGNPSTPSMPSPESQGSPNPGESNDGTTTPDSSSGNEGQQDGQEGTMGDNMDLPPGDVQLPAGDPNGQADGDQANNDGGMMNPENEDNGDGTMIPEDEDNGGGGWETSNQLEPQAGDSEESGNGDVEEDESATVSSSGEDAMQEVLGDLDGEIMDERNAANTRANDEVAEAGSFETETGETESGVQDGDTEGADTAVDDEQQAGTGAGEQDEPSLPETQQGVADTPDSKDKNVVARQLKEAALAEEDPELKEKLWEEYEDYVDGLK
ncbi:MAG: hypothetical protein F4077_11240 [Gammaproteobacteria bacterium]|nr:hypothetical protein [Gammaproteobacteria bacterium]MYI78301.1 hypothetical protein [Gammaproteobacteria bacterium]